MDKFRTFLIFASFVAVTNSQVCSNPKPMVGFKLSAYGTGIWYTAGAKVSFATPLTDKCSRLKASNNGTFLSFDTRTLNLTSKNIMTWKPAGNGVFSWIVPFYQFGPMNLTDLSLMVGF